MNSFSKFHVKFHVSSLDASMTFKEECSLTFFFFLIFKNQISRHYLIRRLLVMIIFHCRVESRNVEDTIFWGWLVEGFWFLGSQLLSLGQLEFSAAPVAEGGRGITAAQKCS